MQHSILAAYKRLISYRYWPAWELPLILAPRILRVYSNPKQIIKISCALYSLGDSAFVMGKLFKAIRFWTWSVKLREEYLKTVCIKPESIKVIDLTSFIWARNIGHIALLTDLIRVNILGYLPGKLRLYVETGNVANDYYLKKCAPFIDFIETGTDYKVPVGVQQSQLQFNMFNTTLGPKFLYNICALADKKWQEEQRPNLISLNESERKHAQKKLSPLGFNPGKWFATFHVRGSRFRDELETTRNTPLDNFTLAIRRVLEAGGQPVVLGEPGVNVPENMTNMIIDYANSEFRSPELDIFLCAECRFFVGVVSGIIFVSGTFGVPAIFTNVTPPISRPWRRGDLWIPKLIWSESLNRYLSLKEMMKPPVCLLDTPENYKQRRLKIYDNSPEEIEDAVADMIDQVSGKKNVDDTDMQQYVRSLDPANLTQPNYSRLSPRFANRRAKELRIKL